MYTKVCFIIISGIDYFDTNTRINDFIKLILKLKKMSQNHIKNICHCRLDPQSIENQQ